MTQSPHGLKNEPVKASVQMSAQGKYIETNWWGWKIRESRRIETPQGPKNEERQVDGLGIRIGRVNNQH